jgi:hypothetical protein
LKWEPLLLACVKIAIVICNDKVQEELGVSAPFSVLLLAVVVEHLARLLAANMKILSYIVTTSTVQLKLSRRREAYPAGSIEALGSNQWNKSGDGSECDEELHFGCWWFCLATIGL